MSLRWIICDFETASTCNLKKAGAWRYAQDPNTEILCLSFGDDNSVTTWTPDMSPNDPATLALRGLVNDPEMIFIAFNVGFEKAIWREMMVKLYNWPNIPNSRWHDVQAVCAMKVLPLDLERAILTLRLAHEKDKEGSKFTIGLSKPDKKGYFNRTPAALQRVINYCERDIAGELGLHHRVGWLPAKERSVWLLNQRINERGIRLDMDFVAKAQEVVDRASAPLEAEFLKLTGGLKMTQVAKFRDWCGDNGFSVPDMQKETLAKILHKDIDGDLDDAMDDPGGFSRSVPDNVHRALSIRQLIGSASIKKLARMQACVCSDGRVRGSLQYHGTGPGRSAGRLLQPHNFPRGTVKHDVQEVVNAIMTGDPAYVEMIYGVGAVEVVLSSLRHAIVPDPGRILLAGDYAGIQARTVLGVAGQHDKTKLMADGVDIYCDMASEIYKCKVTKADTEMRQAGKNSVLGLGFQMGAKKFQFKYAQDFPLNDLKDQPEIISCQRIVDTYRKEWAPLVPKLWYGLQEAAVEAVWTKRPHSAYGVEYMLEDGWLTARLPSGRKLWYFNPMPVRRAMPWDETDVRKAFTYQAMKMGQLRTIDAFGGQLTENVVMGIERDIMTHGMILCEKNGFPICLEVHDEIVSEPLIADADEKAFQQIMEDVPSWVREIQIPVAVETWQSDRYRK